MSENPISETDRLALKSIATHFPEVTFEKGFSGKERRLSRVRELAHALYAVEDDLLMPILGFLLSEYLQDHPKSLSEDDGFIALMYFLPGIADDIEEGFDRLGDPTKFTDRKKLLVTLSLSQVEAICEWIDAASQWECCKRFKFDLERGKTAWMSIAAWRRTVK